MRSRREQARSEFERMLLVILAISVVMVFAVLWWMSTQGDLNLHMVIATIVGVFVSVLLGTGLMALAFFSDKSGHDDDVTDTTRGRDKADYSATTLAASRYLREIARLVQG